jgi:hypothetical protein
MPALAPVINATLPLSLFEVSFIGFDKKLVVDETRAAESLLTRAFAYRRPAATVPAKRLNPETGAFLDCFLKALRRSCEVNTFCRK